MDIHYKIDWTQSDPVWGMAAEVTKGKLTIFSTNPILFDGLVHAEMWWETPDDWPLIEVFNFLVKNWEALHTNYKQEWSDKTHNISNSLIGIVRSHFYIAREVDETKSLDVGHVWSGPDAESYDWHKIDLLLNGIVKDIYTRLFTYGKCEQTVNALRAWNNTDRVPVNLNEPCPHGCAHPLPERCTDCGTLVDILPSGGTCNTCRAEHSPGQN